MPTITSELSAGVQQFSTEIPDRTPQKRRYNLQTAFSPGLLVAGTKRAAGLYLAVISGLGGGE